MNGEAQTQNCKSFIIAPRESAHGLRSIVMIWISCYTQKIKTHFFLHLGGFWLEFYSHTITYQKLQELKVVFSSKMSSAFELAYISWRYTVLIYFFAYSHSFCATLKEQEKLLAQRKVPGLQSQLEEFKSALCQLQAQKQRLQTEVGHSHQDNRV